MSSGPEHYREAEHLLSLAAAIGPEGSLGHILEAAQVHATLALAAAVHDRETGTGAGRRENAWREATASDGTPS